MADDLYKQASEWLNLNKSGNVIDFRTGQTSGGSGSGSGTSARSVSSGGDFSSGISGDIQRVLDQVYQISERNTARSEQQAAQLRDWQERQNKIAMDFNMSEAAKNRDWQQMMSNTAHQREVADLRAAGLNPILSVSGGNGAAVTSGATASGVTSSGAQGQVDQSANQALVGLMSAMWSAQTQLESQRINAQNNMAIAERNNTSAQLIAQLYTQQSREASQLAAEVGLTQSRISAATSELVSRISASAARYGSDISAYNAQLYAEAQKIVGSMNVEASKYNTAVNGIVQMAKAGLDAQTQLDAAGIHASSALDVAKENHWNSQTGFAYNLSRMIQSIFGKSSGFSSRQSGSFGSSRSDGYTGSFGGGAR